MQAGRLDKRIVLQHRVIAKDAQNEDVETYTTYDTIWAGKRDASARELFSSQQGIAENTCRFEIRHRTDVLYTDRIVYGSLNYNIRQIAEIGRNNRLEIVATAVTP